MAVSKATPKSCSCRMCKLGKSTTPGKQLMKLDERAYRHYANQELRLGREPLSVAPKGNRYD